MTHSEASTQLQRALDDHQLPVLGQRDDVLQLPAGYSVEVEGPSLYKLLCDGAVIAPFDDPDALCQFVKSDPAVDG
ncbi:MAG: hypothetical protein WA958_12785 [Tunicatimonas sp.]